MRGHGGSDDRAALRAAARKAHETNAESQYPKWNEHTDQQFKLMKSIGGGDGGNSIRIVEGPPSRSVAARAAADDDEGEKEAEKSEAEKSDASSSETGAESRKSKEKPKKKVAAGRSSGADSQARQKRKATIVKDTVATESDDNAEPKKKLRRRSSKGDANKDDNGGDLEKPKRTSRHFSKNDSPISLEFKSFDAILSKFQQRIWARDGYYRKEGAIDRKLNLQNLLLVADEHYSKKMSSKLKAAFDCAMDDPAEQ